MKARIVPTNGVNRSIDSECYRRQQLPLTGQDQDDRKIQHLTLRRGPQHIIINILLAQVLIEPHNCLLKGLCLCESFRSLGKVPAYGKPVRYPGVQADLPRLSSSSKNIFALMPQLIREDGISISGSYG